jgi:hypothetical protein
VTRAKGALGLLTLALALGGAAGCSKNQLIDVAMRGSPREEAPGDLRVGARTVLAGDLHCHVAPPDAPYHVSRSLGETLALAAEERLDFLVLTPHVPARFFMHEDKRRWVEETQRELRAELAALRPGLLVIPGFEYTDPAYGHVGAAFAEPSEVLGALPAAEARAAPARFFELWVAHGGLLTINHPVNRPLPDAPFRELRYDLSWRALRGVPVPPEIAWLTDHAQSIETFNATVTELRDLYVVGDEDRSLREAAHLADRLARAQRRRVAAVGGSDSHGQWLRATTFVLARERSIEGVREAITTARTCVRGPEACTFEARLAGAGNAWLGVGDAVRAEGVEGKGTIAFEARARGGATTFFVDGAPAATGASGEEVRLEVPAGRCSVLRAIVARSWSSPIYVNCF